MFVPLVIPTGSDHDRSRLPVATLALIGTNIIIYGLSILAGHEQVMRSFGFIAAHPLPHQFLTAMFLHGSLLHLAGNMAFLWFAGSDLEDVLGAGKFLVVYILGGLACDLLFWWTAVAAGFPNLDEPAVGASGAISGLLGLYAVRFPRFKIRMYYAAIFIVPFVMRQGVARISSIGFLGFWIGLQLYSGIQALHAGGAEVAYWGHIGGFFLGLFVGLITHQYRDGEQEYLMKEADHLFYKQKWHQAMEVYKKAAQHDSRCAEAFIKWALCWECSGMLKRAERVLWDALNYYKQQRWDDEAAMVQEELEGMVGKASPPVKVQEPHVAAEQPSIQQPQATPNLLFRKEVKWKGKPR